MADGSVRAAVGLDDTTNLVLGAGLADLFLLPRGDDLVVATRDDVSLSMPANTDATRRVGVDTLTTTPPADRVLAGARATAVQLGRVLAAKSPLALRLAKESMNRVEDVPLRDAYRIEQDYTSRLQRFDDAREARQAFLDGRDPVWTWR